MADEAKPTLYLLAGPNGAGKSTLYETRIKPRVSAEFVNADLIERERRAAGEQLDSYDAARLATQRRSELLQARQSFVTETVFSHESKNELVEEARAAGYQIALYHVNVNRPDLSVKRVAQRVHEGGHDVAEDKIRQRYERNQPLIREAARNADHTFIYDNSDYGRPPRLVARLERGQAVEVNQVPKWARELYREELLAFSQTLQNEAAASFQEARDQTRALVSETAEARVPERGKTYEGPVIAATSLHWVQQTDKDTTVAHFASRLPEDTRIGQQLSIEYGRARASRPTVERATGRGQDAEPER